MRKRPLFCAACMCTLGAFAGSVEWRGISLILLVAATLFLFLGTFALNAEWKQAFGRGIVFLLLFVLFFQHASSEVDFRAVYWNKLTDGTPVTVRGTLYKKEQKNDQYLYYLTGCTTAFSSGSIRTNDVAAYLKSDDYSIGQILTIDAKLNTWKPAENEGGFDARAYYLSQKIDFSIKSCRIRAASGKKSRYKEWLLHIKNRMGAVYEKCLDEEDAGVLKAMILGDKTGLDSDIRELYKKSGISHILAISGLHISFIGMGFYKLVRRLGMGFWSSGVLAGVMVVSYAWMSGASVSAKRACGMLLFALFGMALGKSYDMLTAMGILLAALLWNNPFLFDYSGFVFSFAAVTGVGSVGKVLTEGKRGVPQAFWMSFAIQLMTLPLVAWYYYEIPVYAVFLNLFILPMVSWVVLSGVCGGLFGLIWNTVWVKALFLPARLILAVYEWLCFKMLQLPGAQYICGKPKLVQVVFYYVLLALFVTSLAKKKTIQRKNPEEGRNKQKHTFAAWRLIVLLFVLFFRGTQGFEMDMLDVGQGDGIYLRTGEGSSIFFDGGSTDVKQVGTRRILPFLKYHGVRRVGYWFVSHGDKDHISGLLEVFESGYPVDYLLISAYMPEDEAYERLKKAAEQNHTKIVPLKAGDRICLGNAGFQCLFPTEDYAKKRGWERNACSLVIRYEEAGVSGLFAGDLDTEGERALVRDGSVQKTALFKVDHHGSAGSNSKELLEVLAPELAVISCAKENSYGHPAEEAVQRLSDAGCAIFYTMEEGQIRIRYGEGGYRVAFPCNK